MAESEITTILLGLVAPFRPDQVHWRVGSMTQDKKRGMALAYIDARDVMDRLDAVLGAENWSDSYEVEGARVLCTLDLRLPIGEFPDGLGQWIGKSDGAGDTDVEGAKGAISDAFKRAAVKWGIGRYLYAIDSPWVELDDRKRIVPREKQRLRKLLEDMPPHSAPPAHPQRTAVQEDAEECEEVQASEPLTTPGQRVAAIAARFDIRRLIPDWCKHFGVTTLEELTHAQADKIISKAMKKYAGPGLGAGMQEGETLMDKFHQREKQALTKQLEASGPFEQIVDVVVGKTNLDRSAARDIVKAWLVEKETDPKMLGAHLSTLLHSARSTNWQKRLA